MTPNDQRMIDFNGEPLLLNGLVTVSQLLKQEAVPGSRFVVVINDEIVPKATWAETLIEAGDRVDIMSPISGG